MSLEFVAMGTSLGGLRALETVLSVLEPGFPLPIAIVQHRERHADDTLCELLGRHCRLPVGTAEDKTPILAGRVYVAPPDYHLQVEPSPDGNLFSLSTDPHECHARPSIDVLFESVAHAYGGRSLGILMTGASRDGVQGALRIKSSGGRLLVQSPETAEGRLLPESAIAACTPDAIVPLTEIGTFLMTTVRTRTAACHEHE